MVDRSRNISPNSTNSTHHTDDSEHASSVIIPVGEKLTFKSELFEVHVLRKFRRTLLTREAYYVLVELDDKDPLLIRQAVVEIQRDDWAQARPGDRCRMRLYEQADGTWDPVMPLELPEIGR